MNFYLSFIFSHTITWIVNDHVFVALKCIELCSFGSNQIMKYSQSIETRLVQEKSIIAAVVFGSLSRGELGDASDLDVRVIRHPGIMSAIRSLFFIMRERVIAFINGFPLHIYLFDNIQNLIQKYGIDQSPVILHDPFNIIKKNYKKAVYFKV
ncbi:MAG: nucleotidyltransferase domain-containing protein [Candidatus Hodarchaeota archaeon]